MTPKNILMIGPTGVGKTEISRRLAKLAQAPFIKVEATKFTEVGYVGRDVEQMIRDLVEAGIAVLRDMRREEVQAAGASQGRRARARCAGRRQRRFASTRDSFRKKLRTSELDDREIEVEVERAATAGRMFEIPGQPNMINIQDMIGQGDGRHVRRSARSRSRTATRC